MSRIASSRASSHHATPANPGTPWMRAADLAVALLLILTLWVLASGGIRTTIAGIRVSVSSPERLALLAAAGLVIRYLIWRQSIFVSLRSMLPRAIPAEWSSVAPIWATSRFSVILTGYLAVLLIGLPPGSSGFRVSEDPLANLPARWDAAWYLNIAANGYRWVDDPYQMQNVAFFPAFPWTMRAGGALLGAYKPGIRRTEAHLLLLLGGWLAALATFLAALVYVYRWAEARAGPSAARTTVTLLAAYPFAVYFSAPYSESLYLLSVTAAFLHFERLQWKRAAAWGFLAALVRPTGVLLIIPLAWMAMQWRDRALQSPRFGARRGLAIVAPAAAILLHSLMMYQLTGRPLAWSEVQLAWGRTYQVTTWLGLGLSHMTEHGVLNYVEAAPVTVLNGLAAMMAFALLWPVARRAGVAYALFVILNLLPAIASGGLMSVGRFTSTLFPVFFALALVVPQRHGTSVIVAFSVLQGLIAVLFFTWRPPV